MTIIIKKTSTSQNDIDQDLTVNKLTAKTLDVQSLELKDTNIEGSLYVADSANINNKPGPGSLSSIHVKNDGNATLNLESNNSSSEIFLTSNATGTSAITIANHKIQENKGVNPNTLDIIHTGTNAMRLEGSTGRVSIGRGAPLKNGCILNLNDGAGRALQLPRLNNTQQGNLNITGNNGFLFYNSDTDEPSMLIGGQLQKLHHTSRDIKSTEIENLTSQVASIDDSQTLTNKTIDGNNNIITNIPSSALPNNIDATKIANGNISNQEFQYLDGVTSGLQQQLNNRVDKTSTENIGGNKTFTNSVNTTSSYNINSFGTLQEDRLILKSGTNNTPRIQAIGIDGPNGSLEFQNDSGVRCGRYTNSTCVLDWDYNINLTNNTSAFTIGNNIKLNNTTLGAGVINSSLQNASSDQFNILGQTATDAFLNIQRQTGEQAILKSGTGGAIIANNTKDLITLNNSKAELGTGLNMDIKTGQTYQINSQPVLSANTLQSPVINSSLQQISPANNILSVNNADINLGNTYNVKKAGFNCINTYQLSLNFSTNNSTYTEATTIYYRSHYGWNNMIVNMDCGAGTASVRLYSLTAAQQIGEQTGITGTNTTVTLPLTHNIGGFVIYAVEILKSAGGGSITLKSALFE